MINRSRLWIAFLLGSLLFGVANTAVWSGMLHPPSGYEPLFLVRSHDMAEYTTYMTVASDPTWLTPNLDAPWTLPGGFFDPLMLIPGRIGHWLGLSTAFTFQITFFLSMIGGAWSLLYAIGFFIPTAKQRWWTFAAIVSAVPLVLLMIVIKPLLPFPFELYGLGMIEWAYNSADGLFRSGLSNSFTIACGTIAILLTLTFTAQRVVTGQVRYRYLAALTILVSALLHPFEVFVIGPASAAALLWGAKRSGKWRPAIVDIAWNATAAIAGLLPATLLAFRYPWISDLSTIFTERMYPTWLLTIYGLPCILVVYCLLLRYKPATLADEILMIWWIATAIIVCIPYCPYPPHLLNGFAYITAMLLIRLLFEHRQTKNLYQKKPKLVLGLGYSVLALSLIALSLLHIQLWKDGRASSPNLLLSAVTTTDERAVAQWLRGKVSHEDLVLAPPELAPWLTLVPMHAFASHVQHSFNYTRQLQEATAFYQGEPSETARELIRSYGVRWIVAPSNSPAIHYFDNPPSTEIGTLRVYEIPGNSLKSYPGLAQLVPEAAKAHSLSRLVMDAKAYLTGNRP